MRLCKSLKSKVLLACASGEPSPATPHDTTKSGAQRPMVRVRGRRLVMGSCVIRETAQSGCPWSRPRVSLSIYLSIYLAYTLTCPEPATHHAAVPTRWACRMAAESCLTTSTAATQLQPHPWHPRCSKVKVLERREHRQTRSDRAASSAAWLGRASSLLPELQEPR